VARANAFGYQVLSLNELIEALTDIRDRWPQMAEEPVWVDNCPPLKWPVLNVTLEMSGGPRTKLYVERGGN
jgi:hypothetical protein